MTATLHRPQFASPSLSVEASATREIVFIDSAVTDYADLVAGVRSHVEVIVLDAMRDGVEQISEVLTQRKDLAAVHMVSHGSPGRVQLGAIELSLETVDHYAWQLQAWAEALTDKAELLIYGCEVAKGDRGHVFVQLLSELMDVAVAASTTKMGSAALGGDWELQVKTGEITAPLAFSLKARTAYAGVLAAGDLDLSFGIGGKVTTDFNGSTDQARDVLIQSDGKIVVAGFANNSSGGSTDFALTRYNSNGTLDTTFGTGGKVTTDFSSSSDYGYSVIQQSDGKIVVAGSSKSGSTDFALTRYNSNGTLDTTFGTGGKVTTDFSGSYDVGYSVIQQSDGKIVVAGYSSNGFSNFALTRYNSNGTLDTTFGTGGKVTTDFSGYFEEGLSVIQQSDGKIVVAGYNESSNFNNFALTRYNSNGTLDTTFGTGGKVTTDLSVFSDQGWSVIQQSDGKIVVAGYSESGSTDFALTRYNSNGTLDTTFGTGGKVTTDLSGSADLGTSVIQQSDGKIVVAGYAYNSRYSSHDFALTRYNSNGTLDTTFGTGGKVTTDFNGSYDYGYSVIQQSDGKIVVVGTSGGNFAVARYLGDPINQAPANLSLSSSTVAENTANNTIVGTLSTTDPNGSDTHTYTLLNDAEGRFALSGNQIVVANGSLLDFESSSSYTIRVRTIDNGGLSFEKDLTISLTNINETPTVTNAIVDKTVAEDAVFSFTLPANSFSDPDGNSLTYSATLENGASLPSWLTFNATTRTFSGTPTNDEVGVINVKVTASDGQLSTNDVFTLTVQNTNDAPVLDTSASPVLTAIAEDTFNPAGNRVAEIVVNGSITDVDINGTAPEAIAISAVDNTNGTWQYQLSGGNWTALNFSGANTGKALLLDSTARLRFVPNADYNGTATFSFRAWDQTAGSSGSYFATSAGAGALDTSFGANGIAYADFTNGLDIANAIATQPDGKVIVAGYSHPGSSYRNSAFARFNSNGTLDTSFGTGGKAIVDLSSNANDQIEKIHVLGNGSILATGSAYAGSGFNFALAKLTASGTLDTSFGNNGKIITNLGNNSYIHDSAVLSNGKVIAVGELQNGGFALVRYNSDGTLDTSFSSDGIATVSLASAFDSARSVTATADGKILVAGFYYGQNGQSLGLARFNTDGSLDTSFDGDGRLLVGDRVFVDADLSTIRATALPDGKFLVGATVGYSDGFQATLYRYNSDGTLDSTFGSAGKQRINVNNIAYLYLNDLQVTGDGKIVLGLSANQGTPSQPNFDFAAVRLNANGSLDTGFGTNGMTAVPISTLSTNAADFARAIQINTAGDILIAGYSNQTAVFNGDRQFALVRLKGDTVQTAFSAQSDTAGITIIPVNDAPVLDLNGAASGINFATSFTEDSAPVAIVSNSLTLTDIDSPTISSATITITNLLDGDAESLSLPSTFSYMAATYSTSTGTLMLIGTATLAQYQEVLRTITYSNTSQNPNPTPRTISFVVNDGAVDSAIATSTVTVTPINDAPTGTATASLVAGTEDTAYTISKAQLLAGFSDVDGNALSITNFATSNGNFVQNEDGSFTITGANNYNGSVTVNYKVTDGSLSVDASNSFNLAAVNDAPTLTGTKATLAAGTEDTVYTISQTDLLTGFSDVDGDILSVSNLTASNGSLVNNNNGTWSFTPTANYNGSVNLSYNVTDGQGGSTAATQSFTLAAVNDTPTATNESLTTAEDVPLVISAATLFGNDADVDLGDILSLAAVTQPGKGGLVSNGDGTYTYTPNANYNGTDSFTYTISDRDGATSTATVNLTLNAVNDNPDAVHDIVTARQSTPKTILAAELLANDTDVEGNTLSLTNVSNAQNGTVALDSNGNVVFTANANVSTASFEYTLNDGNGGTDTTMVTLLVGTTLNGGNGRDTLSGTAGDDLLNGDNGNDILLGLAGDDILSGGNGIDKLQGGDGNDRLYGGRGNDLLTGGLGSDIFVLMTQSGTDTIQDFTDGEDKIGLAGGLTFGQLTIGSSNGNTLISTNGGEVLAILADVNSSLITQADLISVM